MMVDDVVKLRWQGSSAAHDRIFITLVFGETRLSLRLYSSKDDACLRDSSHYGDLCTL